VEGLLGQRAVATGQQTEMQGKPLEAVAVGLLLAPLGLLVAQAQQA
jgi:hypothetical protein